MTSITRALSLAALFAAPALDAEIVVLTHGGTMHVESFEVVGERVRLELPGGGRVVMPLRRVERILDDVLVASPDEVAEPLVFELAFAAQPVPAVPYGELIHAAAERHGVNPELVAAVIRAESAFDPRAVSVKGAQGLMQLMPATAERFGLAAGEVFEPARNIDAGTRYLAWLARRFEGRLEWILAAYNAGEGTVDRYGGVPPYRETRHYLRRVLAALGLAGEA